MVDRHKKRKENGSKVPLREKMRLDGKKLAIHPKGERNGTLSVSAEDCVWPVDTRIPIAVIDLGLDEKGEAAHVPIKK